MVVLIKSFFKFSILAALIAGIFVVSLLISLTESPPSSQQANGEASQHSVSARGGNEEFENSVDPISMSSLNRIEGDLWDWAEGRWEDIEVFREGDYHVVALIEIRPEANATAKSSYCRVLEKTIPQYLVKGQTWEAELIQNGRSVKGCP